MLFTGRDVVKSAIDDVVTEDCPKLLLLRLLAAISDGRPPKTPEEPPNEPVNLLIGGADVDVTTGELFGVLKLLKLKLLESSCWLGSFGGRRPFRYKEQMTH